MSRLRSFSNTFSSGSCDKRGVKQPTLIAGWFLSICAVCTHAKTGRISHGYNGRLQDIQASIDRARHTAALTADFGVSIFESTISHTATTTTISYSLAFSPQQYLGSTDRLMAGDYITLYDYSSNLLPTSSVTAPAELSPSVQFVGISSFFPANVYPPDSPLIPNLSFTYTGAPVTSARTFSVSVTLNGNYIYGTAVGGRAFGASSLGVAAHVGISTSYYLPVPAPVPEPSSLAMYSLAGAAAALSTAWQRRRRQALVHARKV